MDSDPILQLSYNCVNNQTVQIHNGLKLSFIVLCLFL